MAFYLPTQQISLEVSGIFVGCVIRVRHAQNPKPFPSSVGYGWDLSSHTLIPMLERILTLAQNDVQNRGYTWDSRLELLLSYAVQSPNFAAFPNVGQKKFDTTQPELLESYLHVWLERYYKARADHLTLKEVGTLPDPAVDEILKAFAPAPDSLETISRYHRISMAAENLLGGLLERYIAQQLEPHGWIWCAGDCLRSIDFLTTDLKTALQIKNRSNSENSSSSAVRTGTEIKKWYRIHAIKGTTNWDSFPFSEGGKLSEAGFYLFIQQYAQN
jgi:hypothetical protein